MSTYATTSFRRRRTLYVRKIRQLLADTFSLSPSQMQEQDGVWSDWVNKARGSEHRWDIEAVRDEFKARWVACCWAPCRELEPFDSLNRTSHQSESAGELPLETYSKPLQDFAVAVLQLTLDTASVIGADREFRKWQFGWSIILDVLKSLNEFELRTRRLFDRFPVEISPRWEISGNNSPFYQLMVADTIPLKWKILADQRMQTFIKTEIKNNFSSGFRLETLLGHYRHMMVAQASRKRKPYPELLAPQVDFMLGCEPHGSNYTWCMPHLAGAQYKELRKRILWAIVQSGHFVEQDLLKEFKSDVDLCERSEALKKAKDIESARRLHDRNVRDETEAAHKVTAVAEARQAYEKML